MRAHVKKENLRSKQKERVSRERERERVCVSSICFKRDAHTASHRFKRDVHVARIASGTRDNNLQELGFK